MKTRWLSVAAMVLGVPLGAAGQTPSPVPAGPVAAPATQPAGLPPALERRAIGTRMGDVIESVQLQNVEAKQAFAWWSRQTGVPLVIDWTAMAREGIDPAKPVTLDLRNIPADKVLTLLLKQVAPEDKPLVFSRTPWYLQIETKEQANRQPVVRIYDIRELLHEVPDFDKVPSFDLNAALSNSGTRGGGGATSLFPAATTVTRVPAKSREERAEEIANLIRDSIEPGIWIERGGQHASIRYFQGRLVVSAPTYVHAQIGTAQPSSLNVQKSLPVQGASSPDGAKR